MIHPFVFPKGRTGESLISHSGWDSLHPPTAREAEKKEKKREKFLEFESQISRNLESFFVCRISALVKKTRLILEY